MLANSPQCRRLLGLLGIFVLLNCVYLVTHWLVPLLAFPVTVGLSTVIVLILIHRWFAKVQQRLETDHDRINQGIRKQQAIINLTPLLQGAFVPFGEWAMEPVHLFNLLTQIQSRNAKVIVECGTGASTLLLGNLVRQTGKGHVFSLEEDGEWHQFMMRHIEAQGLGDWVTLVHAPLSPYRIADSGMVEWYSRAHVNEALASVDQIDALIVDGPKSTSALSRFPALPVLLPKITDKTLIVLDDINRPHEQAVLAEWQKLCVLEVDFNREADRHQAYIRLKSTTNQSGGNL